MDSHESPRIETTVHPASQDLKQEGNYGFKDTVQIISFTLSRAEGRLFSFTKGHMMIDISCTGDLMKPGAPRTDLRGLGQHISLGTSGL